MAFEKIVPTWNATGSEPPESLKNSGFTAGYKPPADYFNWFWHLVSECLTELQEKGLSLEDAVNEFNTKYLPLIGGTLTGNLDISNTAPTLQLKDSDSNAASKFYKDSSSSADNGTQIIDVAKNGISDLLILKRASTTNGDKLVLKICKSDGTTYETYQIYGQHNKPTPADIGAATIAAVTTAQSTADNAVTSASKAQTTATSAASTASSAQTTASNAKSTADTAKSTADSANSTAETAKKTADNAVSVAESARTTASQAKSTADTANSTATSAANAASTAQTTATNAATAASNAQTTANKAKTTAEAAMPKSGGIFTGNVYTQRTMSDGVKVETNNYPYAYAYEGDHTSNFLHIRDDVHKALLMFNEHGVAFYDFVNKKVHPLYGTHYKPTAEDVGALPINGGTLTGTLLMQKTNNGHMTFHKNHDAVNDYGTQLTDYDKDGNWFRLYLSALNNRITVRDSVNDVAYELYGQHNNALLKENLSLNLRTFTELSQIGLTVGSETIDDIAANLPNMSMLIYTVASNNAAIYPTNFGMVTVKRTSAARIEFEMTTTAGVVYKGFYTSVTAGITWTGWIEQYGATNFTGEPELLDSDSYTASSASVTKTFTPGDMNELWLNVTSSAHDSGTKYSYVYFYNGATEVYKFQTHACNQLIHAKRIGEFWYIELYKSTSTGNNFYVANGTHYRIMSSAPINKIVFTDNSNSARTITLKLYGTLI